MHVQWPCNAAHTISIHLPALACNTAHTRSAITYLSCPQSSLRCAIFLLPHRKRLGCLPMAWRLASCVGSGKGGFSCPAKTQHTRVCLPHVVNLPPLPSMHAYSRIFRFLPATMGTHRRRRSQPVWRVQSRIELQTRVLDLHTHLPAFLSLLVVLRPLGRGVRLAAADSAVGTKFGI